MAFFLSNPICSLVISIVMLDSTRRIIAVAVVVAILSRKQYHITD